MTQHGSFRCRCSTVVVQMQILAMLAPITRSSRAQQSGWRKCPNRTIEKNTSILAAIILYGRYGCDFDGQVSLVLDGGCHFQRKVRLDRRCVYFPKMNSPGKEEKRDMYIFAIPACTKDWGNQHSKTNSSKKPKKKKKRPNAVCLLPSPFFTARAPWERGSKMHAVL